MISAEQTGLPSTEASAFEFPDLALATDELGFEDQLIARGDWLAETQLVGTDEVIERAVGRFYVEHFETKDPGSLSHCPR